MDSGWARWILEQYQFPFEKVFPPTLDAGNLNAKYDVLVFVEGGIPAVGAGAGGAQPAAGRHPGRVPSDAGARDRRAHDSGDCSRFVENGGTVITIGASSTNLARHFEAADRRSSRRERQAAAGSEVLRAGIGAHRQGRRHASDRARHEGADRHVLRHQPGVQARRGRGRPGRQGRRVVRHARRRSRAAGRGASSTCRTASR